MACSQVGRKDDAKMFLEAVLKSDRPLFSMRQEARDLLEKLKKEPAKKP